LLLTSPHTPTAVESYCFHKKKNLHQGAEKKIFQEIPSSSVSVPMVSRKQLAAMTQDRCLPLQQPSRDVVAAHCGGALRIEEFRAMKIGGLVLNYKES
jgi:hypothetical protein